MWYIRDWLCCLVHTACVKCRLMLGWAVSTHLDMKHGRLFYVTKYTLTSWALSDFSSYGWKEKIPFAIYFTLLCSPTHSFTLPLLKNHFIHETFSLSHFSVIHSAITWFLSCVLTAISVKHEIVRAQVVKEVICYFMWHFICSSMALFWPPFMTAGECNSKAPGPVGWGHFDESSERSRHETQWGERLILWMLMEESEERSGSEWSGYSWMGLILCRAKSFSFLSLFRHLSQFLSLVLLLFISLCLSSSLDIYIYINCIMNV